MNMKAMMAQAQKMQKNMEMAKNEIDNKDFYGKSELVEVKFKGNKKLINIKIDDEKFQDNNDIEYLEDMLQIAINDALTKIDKEVESKLGSTLGPMGGLF